VIISIIDFFLPCCEGARRNDKKNMNKILHFIKKFIPVKLFKKLQPAYHLTFAWLASFLYKNPSEKLIVIGVTGTTGKTTVIHLIAKTLEEAGYKVGYTSTAMFKIGDKEWNNDKKMTMLGRFFTQKMLRKMLSEKCQYAIIETTSQGIEQFRHKFINYDILIFTGLYPEHIEAHGSFENYKNAKLKLFAHLQNCKPKYTDDKKNIQVIENEIKKIHCEKVRKTVIVNGDSEHATDFLNFKAEEKFLYQAKQNDRKIEDKKIQVVKAEMIVSNEHGIHFVVSDTHFDLKLMGEFNISNALAAIACGLSQGLTLAVLKNGLEKIAGVPGRFERVNVGQNFSVVVDYAFEPNAVAKLYETVKKIKHHKIIHVLGSAGGGRDISRRPVLGRIAGESADIVFVTNEDPYDDNPQIIIDQVALGAEKAGKILDKDLFKILDRREAIAKALRTAGRGDIVLITGKGNEQAIASANGAMIEWDDRKVIREELQKLKK